jgi:hypothetical protein
MEGMIAALAASDNPGESMPRFLAANLLAAEKQAVEAKDYKNAETLKSAKDELDQLLQEQETKRRAEAAAVQARDYGQAAEIAKEIDSLEERVMARMGETITTLEPLLLKAVSKAMEKREGYDKLTLSNGDTYEGQFKGGKYHGQGTYNSNCGTVYVGEFAHGNFNGHGKKTRPDGVVYEGQFKDDRFHGQGTFTASNVVYAGEFRNGDFNGQGKKTYRDGSVFEGQFKDDKYHGHGSYRDEEGNTYVGQWQAGKMHGRLRGRTAQGNDFEADFSHGKIIEQTLRPTDGRGGGTTSAKNTSSTGLRAPLIANERMERDQHRGSNLLSQLRDDPYRANFSLEISAAIDECCGCGAEGDLPAYNSREWRGRLSAAEYASLQHRVKENYCGYKCTNGTCFCCGGCCITTDLQTYLDELNTELRPRGTKISIAARHRTNGTADGWRLLVTIVPI